MLKKKVVLVLISLGFLVPSQMALSHSYFTGTWKIVAELTENYTKLRRVEEELSEARAYYETSWSSEDTIENCIEHNRAISVLWNLQYLLLEIRSQINAVKIYLIGSLTVKDEDMEMLHHMTKGQIELSIQALDMRQHHIAEQRSFVTTNAALHALDKAKDIINTVLNLLRPLKNRYLQLNR